MNVVIGSAVGLTAVMTALFVAWLALRVAGDMASDEVRGWLDIAPRGDPSARWCPAQPRAAGKTFITRSGCPNSGSS